MYEEVHRFLVDVHQEFFSISLFGDKKGH